MTREIKFRCWIKKEKRMDNVDFINFAAQFTGKWECKEPDDLFDVATKRGRLFNLEDVELMQYTGLKDKNGRDIYEGDVVKGVFEFEYEIDEDLWKTTRENIVGEVVFQFGCFGVLFEGDCFKSLYEAILSKTEVIGNIHENLGLLENEK